MYCFFCKKNIQEINFKNTDVLERLISKSGKIKPRKKTGLCASHQREASRAIKRARILGLLPFVSK
ncbi:MAG TPA: 30S ribosomal protein S18 [Candidatus Pacearchaeota archaeon]|nr:30S ribosomal protein S18 [Candidatus Parcubacteria bacterium]HNP79458.1 30S ribosomal protein S18 [Candidatus Pacearchaeota archaeon]HOC53562.1 30S ribosomal protein S18 [Candidatus Pacearchaeota archaeon]HQM24479.1 30S ribosomal protein S18 [Candidatus Pacearchaeota archaeon]